MKISEILKTTGIIKATKEESLGAVLNQLSSSHDAAFIFEDENFKKYLGVINPYYCLIKRFYPPETKVEKILFHAPKLKFSDDLKRASRLMIESKVHYLPVFDDKKGEKFLGIATARRILRRLLQTKRLDKAISSILGRKRPVVLINENDSLRSAINKFKEDGVSKLVVVDSHGHLQGVLAYYDLIPLVVFPKHGTTFGDRVGDRIEVNLNAKIKNYMKSFVLTLTPSDTLNKAAELILDKQIGSVVIVDFDNKPVNIITTRDILEFGFRETSLNEFSEVEIVNVKEKHLPFIKTFVEKLLTKAKKRNAKVRVWVKEEKHGGVIKMKIELEINGELHYFTKEDKNIKKLLFKMDNALEEYI